jgi:hypothetical protein
MPRVCRFEVDTHLSDIDAMNAFLHPDHLSG